MITSNLLLDKHPLQVMPKLATLIGLNEAIVLQQIHYWLKHKQNTGQDFIDGHYWVYNTYEQWQEQFPFWSIMTIRRAFTSLEKKGLLIVGNYNRKGFDKAKWYTINYESLDQLDSQSVQNEQANTIDYTRTTAKTIGFNVLNGAVPETVTTHQCNVTSKPFDKSILERQVIKECRQQGIKDFSAFVEIITFYYETYMRKFHKEHPRLSESSMESVVSALNEGSEMVEKPDPETYKAMIEQHFQTEYTDCDYNILHFMTEGIRNNRFYEACY